MRHARRMEVNPLPRLKRQAAGSILRRHSSSVGGCCDKHSLRSPGCLRRPAHHCELEAFRGGGLLPDALDRCTDQLSHCDWWLLDTEG